MFNLAILRHNRLRPVSNYLFGIVFRVFPTRSRFHKFQYCSIFKVLCRPPLAGSSFIISHSVPFVKNFFEDFFEPLGLSADRCRFRDSLFILLHSRSFVKTFFEVFFCRFRRSFSGRPAASSLLLSGARLRSSSFWLWNRCRRSRQLVYNITGSANCQHLFSNFFDFFCRVFSSPISGCSACPKTPNIGAPAPSAFCIPLRACRRSSRPSPGFPDAGRRQAPACVRQASSLPPAPPCFYIYYIYII